MEKVKIIILSVCIIPMLVAGSILFNVIQCMYTLGSGIYDDGVLFTKIIKDAWRQV